MTRFGHHLIMFALVLLLAPLALADVTTHAATTITFAAYWAQLVIVSCSLAAYALRRFAPQGHFFHTDFGAAVLTGSVFVLGAISTGVQAHGLSLVAVLQAVIGAGATALGLSNPSVASGTTAPMAMKKQAGKVSFSTLMFVAILALIGVITAAAFAGCASVPAPTAGQWKTAGIDAGKCVAPAIINAAGDAIVEALDTAGKGLPQDPAAWKVFGTGLAAKYGPQAALCAVGKLWLDLGGPNLFKMKGEPSKQLLMADWLVTHTSEWLPGS